jgi:hypothetical protein
MSNWTKNNLAHRRTFLTLRILEQTKRQFEAAADQKMSQLKFCVPGDSAQMRKEKARSLASMMNNVFMDAFKTTFETNFDKTKSVNAMTDVLIVDNSTVQELADAADQCYQFAGEDS